MRIEALILSAEGPVYTGVLRLGDVTVLTGRNDVGKTRVLRHIEQSLTRPRPPDYLELLGLAAQPELDAFLVDVLAATTGIIRVETAAVAPFLDAVELPTAVGEVHLGVLLSGIGELLPGWRYGRALIDLDETTRAELEERLEEQGLDRKPAEEPLKLEPLGAFDPGILPVPITVPCPAAEMERRVADGVVRLTRALRALAFRWQRVADAAGPLAGGPPLDWISYRSSVAPSELEPSGDWLLCEDQDAHSSRVHPAALEACLVFERIVVSLLPGFIADDYWLKVAPCLPTQIALGRHIVIRMLRRDSLQFGEYGSAEHDGPWFELEHAASGFVVWIQLALNEAIHRTQRFTYLIQQHVLRLHRIEDEGYGRLRGVTYSLDEVLQRIPPEQIDRTERDERVARRFDGLGLEELKAGLEDLLTRLRDPRLPLPPIPNDPICQPDPEQEIFLEEDEGEALEPAPRDRLYLLDEPEQRLHPLLQRRAARWLGTLMSQWGAQCIVATHSVAFMDMPGNTTLYEITRAEDQAMLVPRDRTSLTPYSQLAREMGLDRGELLALTRAFLITTPPIAALLDELCPERVEHGQITVIPVEEDQPTQLLAAALLARLTAIPVAVLLTTISPEELEELRTATAEQRTEASISSSSAAAAAALIDFSNRYELDIHILTLNTNSPLDLLDHDAVGRRDSGQRRQDEEETVRVAARQHRNAGLALPEKLNDVLWTLEQLALASDAERGRA